MSVILLVLILLFLGVVAYFVKASSRVNATFKWLIFAVLIVVAAALLLDVFGLWDALKSVKVPKL